MRSMRTAVGKISGADPDASAIALRTASSRGDAGAGTQLTFFNELEGRGIGALLARFALSSARKGADDFAQSIKTAVEAAAVEPG